MQCIVSLQARYFGMAEQLPQPKWQLAGTAPSASGGEGRRARLTGCRWLLFLRVTLSGWLKGRPHGSCGPFLTHPGGRRWCLCLLAGFGLTSADREGGIRGLWRWPPERLSEGLADDLRWAVQPHLPGRCFAIHLLSQREACLARSLKPGQVFGTTFGLLRTSSLPTVVPLLLLSAALLMRCEQWRWLPPKFRMFQGVGGENMVWTELRPINFSPSFDCFRENGARLQLCLFRRRCSEVLPVLGTSTSQFGDQTFVQLEMAH